MRKRLRRAVEAFLAPEPEPEVKPKTRVYGHDKTWHQTGEVNVELYEGRVVSVWFRCSLLPFTQTEVDLVRAGSMNRAYQPPWGQRIVAIEFEDRG